MPYNFNDPVQKQEFKDKALAGGADPIETEKFIQSKMSEATAVQPTPEPTALPAIKTDLISESLKPIDPVFTPKAPEVKNILPTDAITTEQPALPVTPQLPVENAQVAMMATQPLQNQTQNEPAGAIIPFEAVVTQPFGNRSSVEKSSRGINLGADFRAPTGTPMGTPPGKWEVVQASPGWNGGSGNMVKIRNMETGDTIGYEHLSEIKVKPGQKFDGSVVVGLSGGDQGGPGEGNSTGAHASIPYQDKNGRYRDIMTSPYANSLFGGK